ncbi:EAL domain-containing protein [Pseudomaricurvus alkylphenolicus]|jgi:diguanylate cyclase (GGDEF)-like protein|uniref:putative bifunctional diguanylate cyclase/phosphodiesterase n=1 Tax=Pseudomaricurvus alkylphenolicus TaxID=1306991 RepID=UPI00141FED64|nr:bifunctional diguanylate cyclase/phosphodiesterase [Pseudomaricurvus alkylphenolicus]NIB39589.1 EAL domain-containing protein [Pseudomaricurvus alkylphenolicus]
MFTEQTSLQNKILAIVVLILVLITALVSVTTLWSAYQHSRSQLQQNFNTSRQVFLYKLKNDGNTLSGALQNAAKDFNTKQLIASGREDPESLQAVMVSQQGRAGADFTQVFDQQEEPLLSNGGPTGLSPAGFVEDEIHLRGADGQVYLVGASGVKFLEQQPSVDAWLLMGINLRRMIDEQVQKLTGFDVHVYDGDRYVVGTSPISASDINHTLSSLPLDTNSEVDIGDQAHIAFRFQSNPEHGDDISFVFTIKSSSAFLNFTQLSAQVVLELALAIVAAFFLSLYLSRSVTRPLRTLADVAKRIAGGDYHSPIPSFKTTEVRHLSQAFEGMQAGINAREQEINQLAYYDSLTDLPNRNSFIRTLQDKIASEPGKPFAVMMLDLDRFKEINDTIGHNFGDQLLKLIACRLESLSLADAFYAHVGGDEFAILLRDIDGYDVTAVVNQYTNLFDLPFDVEGVHLDVDASFGLALYPQHSDSAYGMMQCADIALYKCKESHHSSLTYQSDFNTLSIKRLNLMSELRLAIEKDQLQLFYQPKLCLHTQHIVSVESLVRWVHPEHGFINPDDFIPLAEQSGTIRELTHWAISTALRQHCEWRKQGIRLRFAVNISALDLVDLSLPAYVSQQLSEHRVDAQYLTLEVTESAVMNEPDAAIRALDMLRRMGIKLSIDDFGTGYSSMAYLKQMPVSELKVDKAFVMDMANNSDDAKIVKSTVDLAHNLGLSVVAEGVEDELALDILRQYRVEFAQGYFIAKPMKPADFQQWIEQTTYWNHADEECS